MPLMGDAVPALHNPDMYESNSDYGVRSVSYAESDS